MIKENEQKLIPSIAKGYWCHKFQMERQAKNIKKDFAWTDRIIIKRKK